MEAINNKCQVVQNILPVKKSAITSAQKTENTRNLIALVFIISYLALLVFLIILSAFYQLEKESAKDYLLAIGTPLGFIIGYYFKVTSKG